jgi:four helix bundle protein
MNLNSKELMANKSFRFGVDSYRLCSSLMKTKNEFVLSRQLMRSASAVGALYAESEYAQSKADFVNKLAIARKECNESRYWIAMMLELGLLDSAAAQTIQSQANELMRLLTASIKTAQSNLSMRND